MIEMTLSSRDIPKLKGGHPLYVVDKGLQVIGHGRSFGERRIWEIGEENAVLIEIRDGPRTYGEVKEFVIDLEHRDIKQRTGRYLLIQLSA